MSLKASIPTKVPGLENPVFDRVCAPVTPCDCVTWLGTSDVELIVDSFSHFPLRRFRYCPVIS